MWQLIVCTSCVLAGQAPAKPAAADMSAAVLKLVRQLDAPELSQRDAAEQELVKLGPAALPHLPKVSERTAAETAQRLARVRQTLEKEQAVQAGQASKLTLKFSGVPVVETLASISKATGNAIEFDANNFDEAVTAAKVDAEFKDTPFWEALDTVLDQANLTVDEMAGGAAGALVIVPRPDAKHLRAKSRSIQGAFRVHALRYEASRELTQAEGGSLRLVLHVGWEPRLRLVAIDQPLDELKVRGGDMDLQVENAAGQLSWPVNQGTSSVELTIPLAPPPRSVASINQIKGKLTAIALGPVESFRFDKLPIHTAGQAPPKVELSKAGATVAIDQVRKNNDLWEVRTRIRFDARSKSFESHTNWVADNDAYLVGPNKKRIPFGGTDMTATGETEFGMNYLFFDLPKGPAGLSFVYLTPVSVLEVPVEYELSELPLP